MLQFKRTILSLIITTFSFLQSHAQQWNGLTYYSNMNSSNGYLIDTNSVVIKTYTFNIGTGYSTHFSPGGNFVRSCQNPGNILTGGGMTGRLQKLDYNGTVLWDWTYSSSTYCLHHDHCVLPNGNILAISYDVHNATDLANAGCTSTLTSIQAEKIIEIQPVGSNSAVIVWQWNVWDHLVQNVTPTLSTYQSSIVNHPELLNINYKTTKDWMHMNGIDYNPILDQIVVSSHNLNEWYVIDHSTTTAEAATHSGGKAGKGGDFLYRWGNPPAYQAVGSPSILNVTHDAHWVPQGCPGAGNFSGINNKGVTSPSNFTTIDMITPPRVDYNYTLTLGSAFTPSTYGYRHQSTGYTSNMGSVDEFPNGNRMICLATAGTIYEIDAAGNTLWSKSTLGSTPQSHRYTTCYLNNQAPSQPSISLNGSDLVSTSATTYQWYYNGNLLAGATSQSYTPSQNGYYVVRTTDANGCVFVYSTSFLFGTLTKVSETEIKMGFSIFPNPSEGKLQLQTELNHFEVSIHSMTGSEIYRGKDSKTIDLMDISAGIYFVRITAESGAASTKMISIIK